jgi:selenocysteine lyase/cysteine desulfurase
MVAADEIVTRYASLKGHFSRALAGGAGRLHLAAHSHHLWPDVTFDAQLQAWNDAATLWDGKWSRVFGEILPEAQRHVARHCGVSDPTSIAFAPNTHEFVLRLLSALPSGIVPRVLCTDGEFHSFARQMARLREDGLVSLDLVPAEPFDTFPARFAAAARAGHDLVFFSQVLFNSGYAVPDLAAMVASVPDADTLVVIDGYHAFMALPVDLRAIEHRVFYLGGGYKYACAGEGACFLICPPNVAMRPRDTGWYAAFGALSAAAADAVPYASDGGRFMGATFDPSGLYRLNAAMRWLDGLAIGPAEIHDRALAMQHAFMAAMGEADVAGLRSSDLIVPPDGRMRGNFLAYRSSQSARLQARMEAAGIITDVRGDVLRIGFGLYHDVGDVPEIVSRIKGSLERR